MSNTIEFKPASLSGRHVRMAITGASGAGKTLSALKIAAALGKRVVVIDTEDESADLFVNSAGVPQPYDVYPLKKFQVANYVALMNAAADQGYEVCIVDSLTPSWNKKSGILDQVGGNILNWQKIGNPQYEELMDTIKSFRRRMHIICTLRADMSYGLEPDQVTGKMRVVKYGMKAEHRKDTSFEFDIVGYMDQTHTIHFNESDGKTRCEILDNRSFEKPGAELGIIIRDWLS